MNSDGVLLPAGETGGIGLADLDVVELHDCFAQNELITYEAPGLCREGGAAAFIASGDNTCGGRTITKPSGMGRLATGFAARRG